MPMGKLQLAEPHTMQLYIYIYAGTFELNELTYINIGRHLDSCVPGSGETSMQNVPARATIAVEQALTSNKRVANVMAFIDF